MGPISQFIEHNYRHFNAGALRDVARGYKKHIEEGGKMFVTLAGAMSTAELGISLAEMIRQGKVHGISCTGANLEEDLYNAVAHNSYERIPNYRDLTPKDEWDLVQRHLNRVTDTCIPEDEAIRKLFSFFQKYLNEAIEKGESYFPHQYMYKVILDPEFQAQFQIPHENSWMLAAAERNLPIFVPGWEDSTTGNITCAESLHNPKVLGAVKTGIHYMQEIVGWYKEVTKADGHIGFFQIGGGIAGDFPICVVPLIQQDLEEPAKYWSYFAQITDAQESYGGYSGALPNEKITWGKLDIDTPKFVIHSDATIVAPLVFNYVLGN
jgi:deoxyhypusine synthase